MSSQYITTTSLRRSSQIASYTANFCSTTSMMHIFRWGSWGLWGQKSCRGNRRSNKSSRRISSSRSCHSVQKSCLWLW